MKKKFPYNINEAYDTLQELADRLSYKKLDFSLDSLDTIEEIIEFCIRNTETIGHVAITNITLFISLYVGEVFLKDSLSENGFEWDVDDNGCPMLRNNENNLSLFIFNKVKKKIAYVNDEEGSLLLFYQTALKMLDNNLPKENKGIIDLGDSYLVESVKERNNERIRKLDTALKNKSNEEIEQAIADVFYNNDSLVISGDEIEDAFIPVSNDFSSNDTGLFHLPIFTSVEKGIQLFEDNFKPLYISSQELFLTFIFNDCIDSISFNASLEGNADYAIDKEELLKILKITKKDLKLLSKDKRIKVKEINKFQDIL